VEKSTILLHQELDFSTSVEITSIVALSSFDCAQDDNVKNYTNNYDLLFVQFVIHTILFDHKIINKKQTTKLVTINPTPIETTE